MAANVLPFRLSSCSYKKEYFSFDLTAGLTVGVMAIPQVGLSVAYPSKGMAYAMLANLPPIYGLYGCIVPVFMYGLLGTSSQVHIGPFALISMMVSSALSFVNAEESPDEYMKAVTTLCLECGILHLLLGLCHGGVITRLLSETICRVHRRHHAQVAPLPEPRHLSGSRGEGARRQLDIACAAGFATARLH